jgi:hypothetical protein
MLNIKITDLKNYFLFLILLYKIRSNIDILGIGDWGLGIGDWGLGPIPNPQSPLKNFVNSIIR